MLRLLSQFSLAITMPPFTERSPHSLVTRRTIQVLDASSPLKGRVPRHPDDTLERQPLSNHSQCCADRVGTEATLGNSRVSIGKCFRTHLSQKPMLAEQFYNPRLVSIDIVGTGSIFKGHGEVPIREAPLLARTNIPNARHKLPPLASLSRSPQ